ncbi:complement factor B-like isoform X2 [Aquarana catesbeiana]|uniref:complement factor B-like isoform X2 n=1 Tax=Aquarana catesbeiana TaxID=8400 RepID=UPI003CC93ACE
MLPLLLLIHIALTFATPEIKCDLTKLAIDGGNYTLSDGGNIGSEVHYSCPKEKYPYPSFFQKCLANGQWTNAMHQFVCKDVHCPGQLMFEGGEYFPRKAKHNVGDVLNFQCYAGFSMTGPERRICQEDGQWSGTTTTCQNYLEHCSDPGVPPGATKAGTSYGLNDKVRYWCQAGLHLIGSKERQCMWNKQWSGAEPFCKDRYMYDTPEKVAESFSYSIAEIIAGSKPVREDRESRKLRIRKEDPLNIFIVIDTSKSVGIRDFRTAKDISESFIEKISSYDIVPRFAVISYASTVKTIASLNDNLNPEEVIENLKTFRYSEHDDKTGTNTRGALAEVCGMLSLDLVKNKEKFLETRNIILLLTDGKYNMGGDPAVEIQKIRELLYIEKGQNDREQYLDVYTFGLGIDVIIENLNDVASKKEGEKHVFQMENIDSMKSAFDEIIDETYAFDMCGLAKDHSEDGYERFPWIVKITITRPGHMENCKGSIVTKNFILTAAHCFHLDDEVHYVSVELGPSDRAKVTRKVKNIHRHPKYDPNSKRDKNVPKSFEYDLALVELSEKIEFSPTVRPICLPCTSGTSWALKQRDKAVSCKDHENVLLSGDLVKALFITEERRNTLEQMNVQIKQGNWRQGCLNDAKKVEDFKDVADIKDVVTDNFLCTGGIDPEVDPQTCKGDGGGPLIIQHKKRYIQVGVISWGTVNSCKGYKREQVPAASRDFHAGVIPGIAWIEEIIKDELIYLK